MSPHITLMPHAVCWREDPRLIWTMAVTNFITFLSYATICFTLLYLVRRTRRVIARDWAYFIVGFALFIVACGSTHLMDVVTTWVSVFWIDAWTSIITAVLSAWVAAQLIRRAASIGFSINDYADRLANTESEKARMTESLLQARKLDDWSRLSTTIAHEIANPLEAVQNLLYLIRNSENISREVDEMAKVATAEVNRVVVIARSTLGFFRQSAVPEAINVREAGESVRFLLNSLISSLGVRLEMDGTGDLTVMALSGELRQVLLNLIRNACEACTHPGSTVRVRFTGTDSEVRIVVDDEGQGIDPAILPNLFQFGTSTKGDRGNGMGLWTVERLVSRHGGRVEVNSKPGVGSTFTVHWPRVFSPSEALAAD